MSAAHIPTYDRADAKLGTAVRSLATGLESLPFRLRAAYEEGVSHVDSADVPAELAAELESLREELARLSVREEWSLLPAGEAQRLAERIDALRAAVGMHDTDARIKRALALHSVAPRKNLGVAD